MLLTCVVYWLMAAALTFPLLLLLEGLLLLFRGPEYRMQWIEAVDSKEPSGKKEHWRVIYQWPLIWGFWLICVFKGVGLVEHLHLKEKKQATKQQLLSRTLSKMPDRRGMWTWTFQIDTESNRVVFYMLVSAGPLLVSHLVFDDYQGNYTIARCGELFPPSESGLTIVSVKGIEPLTLEDAFTWCEEDYEWVSLCAQLTAGVARRDFLVAVGNAASDPSRLV